MRHPLGPGKEVLLRLGSREPRELNDLVHPEPATSERLGDPWQGLQGVGGVDPSPRLPVGDAVAHPDPVGHVVGSFFLPHGSAVGFGDERQEQLLLRAQTRMTGVHLAQERFAIVRRARSVGARSALGWCFEDLHLSRDLHCAREGSLGGGTQTLPNMCSTVNPLSRGFSGRSRTNGRKGGVGTRTAVREGPARTRPGARPDAISRHVTPVSSEANTLPSDVPNAASDPSGGASRQCVSMLSSNHSGTPSRQRSNAPPESAPRYRADCPTRGPREADTSTTSPHTTTDREYVASSPSVRSDHEPPRSVLTASPPAHAPSTSSSAVVTWWTSSSMSIVGVQPPPPSVVRRIPPTCTLTYTASSHSAIERVSGGPPHGVCHFERPSAESNAATASSPPLPSSEARNSRASDEPTNTPASVAAMHRARSGSVRPTGVHVRRSGACHTSDPSTMAHSASRSGATAVTDRPRCAGWPGRPRSSNHRRPSRFPTRTEGMNRCYARSARAGTARSSQTVSPPSTRRNTIHRVLVAQGSVVRPGQRFRREGGEPR